MPVPNGKQIANLDDAKTLEKLIHDVGFGNGVVPKLTGAGRKHLIAFLTAQVARLASESAQVHGMRAVGFRQVEPIIFH